MIIMFAYVCECVGVCVLCTPKHIHSGGQQRALGILLYHFLPSSLGKGQVCGGLNEDVLHRLLSLCIWSPAGELLRKG